MSVKGSGVSLWEAPVLKDVAGKDYPLRRLGLLDIERLAGITRMVSRGMDMMKFSSVDDLTPAAMVGFLIDFIPHAMDDMARFMASMIGLKPGKPFDDDADKKAKKSGADPNEGTIRDPSVFPLGSEVRLLELLAEHEDVLNFFSVSKELANNSLVKKLKDRWGALSTESSTDTDGQTNTSQGDDSQPEETD
jgi:hypothetical protein